MHSSSHSVPRAQWHAIAIHAHLQPRRASSNAIALPMPSVAPVTTAHFPYLRGFFAGRIIVR
eukprot:3193401-Pleurochrysis_carterae.AAC.1